MPELRPHVKTVPSRETEKKRSPLPIKNARAEVRPSYQPRTRRGRPVEEVAASFFFFSALCFFSLAAMTRTYKSGNESCYMGTRRSCFAYCMSEAGFVEPTRCVRFRHSLSLEGRLGREGSSDDPLFLLFYFLPVSAALGSSEAWARCLRGGSAVDLFLVHLREGTWFSLRG